MQSRKVAHGLLGAGTRRVAVLVLGILLVAGVGNGSVRAVDPYLEEAVAFTDQVLFLSTEVPALVIAAVRDGETAISGFGERADGSGAAPDGDTVMRLGSITKAFTGEMLAHLAAEGTVALTDPLAMHAPEFARPVQPDERPIRLIDLATHSAGLPREVPHEPGPPNDPFATITQAAFIDFLRTEPLLFEPGSAILYSNFGFDLLAAGLAGAAQEPYPELFAKYITRPLGMTDTTFEPSDGQIQRLMQGHDFDGDPLPDVPTGSVIVGSGGLYSTPHDILQWLSWHLDRFGETDAEPRLLDHAAWRQRDGLESVLGMDESGHMDAMGLGWVIMMPEGNRPLILQKAGGLQGIFTYVAFAPTSGVGAFVAISAFKFSAAMTMAETINELIATLAPR